MDLVFNVYAHRSAAADPQLQASFSANPAPGGRGLSESSAESSHLMDSVNVEIGIYIGLLYFTVEVFRGDEAFADELSAFLLINSVLWITLTSS